jgi:hypothetical protein
MTVRPISRFVAVTLALVAVIACGPTRVTSALSQQEARSLVEHALSGFAAGDYGAWSRDWSPAMKSAIGADAFLSFRDQLTGAVGRYQRLEGLELVKGRTRGFVRWNAIAVFERGRVRFGFGFSERATLVEGVFPEVLP